MAVAIRFLLFLLLIAGLAIILYFIILWLLNRFNYKSRVVLEKHHREHELDNEEADIIISDIKKKSLKDRYKFKEPRNPAVQKAITKKKTVKKKRNK